MNNNKNKASYSFNSVLYDRFKTLEYNVVPGKTKERVHSCDSWNQGYTISKVVKPLVFDSIRGI